MVAAVAGVLERLAGTGGSVLAERYSSLGDFLAREIRTDSGPYTLDGREALREPLEALDGILAAREADHTLTFLKGTQIGFTTIGVGLALYCAAVLRLNVGYFLPDQDFADRFDDTRIKPVVRSQALKEAMRDGSYLGSARKGLKEFPGADGSRFLYAVGLRDIGNAISMPMDVLIRDEVDDIPPENLRWSNDRLDASSLALTVNFAMGRLPGAGIHAMYLEGDQRTWSVRCRCGAEHVLEELWPELLGNEGGRPVLLCPACGMELYRELGEWAPRNPSPAPKHVSYRIPQLAVGAIRLERIASKWRAARLPSDRAKFRCSALGLPDAGDMQPITEALLRRLQEGEPYAMEIVA